MEKSQRDLIYPCDCGGDHFLRITWWPVPDSDGYRDHGFEVDGYLHVGGDFFPSLKNRFRTAWNVIRRGHADTYVGVCLTPDNAREMMATLSEIALEWTKSLAELPPLPEDKAKQA